MNSYQNSFVTELMKISDKDSTAKIDVDISISIDEKGILVFTKALVGLSDRYVQVVDHPQEIEDVLHSNDFFEMLYSPSGRINIEINNKQETINKDEILFLNKNISYKVKKIPLGNDLLCHVFINEDIFDDVFYNLLPENNVFSLFIVKSMFLSEMYNDCLKTGNIEGHIFTMLELLRAYTKNNGKRSKKELIPYLVILFDKLNDFDNNLIETDEFIHYYKKNAQILEIVGYIRKNYKTADLKSVAQHVHIHANYLCNLVKSVTGKTFTEMLNTIRMQVAKHMLESSALSVESISFAVGYDNPSYFYKTFKNIYGVTPRECETSENETLKKLESLPNNIYSASQNDINYLMSKKLDYNNNQSPKIAFMPMGTELNYYMISMGDGLHKGLNKKDVEIYTAAPQSSSDIEKQNEILGDVIKQKPHGIILCSHDLDVAAPLLKRAIDAGIIICLINHDNKNLPVPVHAVVGYRQKESTRRMGSYVAEKMKYYMIKAGVIRGVSGYHSAQRFSGFLEPLLDNENFDLVSIKNGLWNEQSGFEAASEILLEHPQINLIYCENDHEAVGAIKAARQLERHDVKIIGHDGAISGLRNIATGDLFATTDTHPVKMGSIAIMALLNCLNGNITAGFIETPTDIVDKRNVVTALVKN